MKVSANHAAVRREQDFAVYVLSNEAVEVAVVPELGARIISLKNRRTGREWMWHPAGGLKLFRNRRGDAFSQSPLVGLDECLPTVESCVWQGRQLPDHGEAWAVAWDVDDAAWKSGILRTSVKLNISPFDFERTIEVDENEVRLSYRLLNRSSEPEYFIWAMHPLLRLQPEDRLVLPPSTREMLNGKAWHGALASVIPEGRSAKMFAGPLESGLVAVQCTQTGERIEFEWMPAENDSLGLWLTRGEWHGHHQFAIEPTNSDADGLTAAVARKRCGMLGGNCSTMWQVCVRVC